MIDDTLTIAIYEAGKIMAESLDLAITVILVPPSEKRIAIFKKEYYESLEENDDIDIDVGEALYTHRSVSHVTSFLAGYKYRDEKA